MLRQGDDEQAIHLFTARSFLDNADLRISVPEALAGVAATACIQGQVQGAARFAGATKALYGLFGTFISPTVQSINMKYAAHVQSRIDAKRFTEAWYVGRAMAFESGHYIRCRGHKHG